MNEVAMNELSGARVLITGGAGVVGSTIADQLVDAGVAEIVVVDNFSRGRASNLAWALQHGPVTVLEGDIRDRSLLATALTGIDVVFHEAALRLPLCAAQPRLALEVMVDGTFNVVDAAQKAGVSKIVAASSASVYGMADSFPTPEAQAPYGNRTLYGVAKTFGEGLLRTFHEMFGLDYLVLRYFNVYGPRMDVHSAHVEVLIRWMQRIDQGRPPVISGDGSQSMDFVYVDDVARANVLAAMASETDDVFNVASGSETTLLDLASLLAELMGSDLEPEFSAEPGSNPVPRRWADTSRCADVLGFRATVGLREGLERLISWWRADQRVMREV
jgi:UDP-glucose 4-epimerase